MENTKEESKKDGDNFDNMYTVSKKNENQKIALFPEDEKTDTKDEQSGTVKLEELKTMTEKKVKSTVSKRRNSSLVRQLVSKSKNRFCFDGFDLDLTYITPKIIAMGKPSTSIEGIYRNSVEEVQQFFNTRHKNHYKVYNLCQENNYPDNVFYAQGYYPFQDHEAPPLELIYPFCQDAKKFLDESEENVVAIHCKAGKGRTGTFISCLLLYLHVFDTAAQCLSYYGMMRAEDGKGVTIPSQIRYVYYFEKIIKNNIKLPLEYKTICLMKIRMVTIPDISSVKSGCTPSFSVENNGKSFKYWEFNKKKESYDGSEAYADFQIGESGFNASGDVKITFYHIPLLGSKEKIFKLWFNTNFIPDDGVLVVKKDLIDKACKDKNCKKFKPNFKIEIHCIEY